MNRLKLITQLDKNKFKEIAGMIGENTVHFKVRFHFPS